MNNFRYSKYERTSSSVTRRTRKRLKRLGRTRIAGVDASDGITGGEARAVRNALRSKRTSAGRSVTTAPNVGGQKPYRRIKNITPRGGKTH